MNGAIVPGATIGVFSGDQLGRMLPDAEPLVGYHAHPFGRRRPAASIHEEPGA